MTAKDDLGRRGEAIAAEFLESAGLTVIDRNWRCRLGELDLVARDEREIVVVEVKTRSGLGFGHPFEAVTPRKLARLRLLAGQWRNAHPALRLPVRIDVVGVTAPHGRAPRVEHLRGVG